MVAAQKLNRTFPVLALGGTLVLWSGPAWSAEAPPEQERAAQDLACPRSIPELLRPASPLPFPGAAAPDLSARVEQDIRWLRERENWVIQQNLLRSEQEARRRRDEGPREESRFEQERRSRREDPGSTNSPNGRIDTPFPTFIWTPVTKATGYWIRVERADGWSVLETAPAMPFRLFRSLPPGWIYRWYYRGWNEEVGGGPWCVGGVFDLGADLLRPPELLEPKGRPPVEPTGRQFSSTPTFRWTRVPRAEQYHFILEAAEGGVIHEAWVQATTLVLPFALEAGEHYRWRVSSWHRVDGEGWPSPDEEFETAAPPLAPPTPLQPTVTAPRNPPTFSWSRVPGAVLYRLTVLRGEDSVVLDDWTRDTEYTPRGPLPADTSYRWWVRPWNGKEGEGQSSPATPFRIPPDGG